MFIRNECCLQTEMNERLKSNWANRKNAFTEKYNDSITFYAWHSKRQCYLQWAFHLQRSIWWGLKKTWDSYNPTDPKLSSDPISYFYFYANLCKFVLNYANLWKFVCKFFRNFFDKAFNPCRMSNKLFDRNAKLKLSTLNV